MRTISPKVNIFNFLALALSPLLVPSTCLQLQPDEPLSSLPLHGTRNLLQGWYAEADKRWDPSGNYSTQVVEARSGRMKRDMFYFPRGSKITFRFQIKSTLYTSGTTPTSKLSTDLRLEISFKLPNEPASRRRRRSATHDRTGLYKTIINMMDRGGLPGRTCLLKAVCEVADQPMEEYGLLGEVVSLLLGAGHLERNTAPVPSNSWKSKMYGNSSRSDSQLQYSTNENEVDVDSSFNKQEKNGYWNKMNRLFTKTDKKKSSRRHFRGGEGSHSSPHSGDIPPPHSGDIPPPHSGEYFSMNDFLQAEEYGRNYGDCWTAYPGCLVSTREIVYDALSTLTSNNHLLVHDEL